MLNFSPRSRATLTRGCWIGGGFQDKKIQVDPTWGGAGGGQNSFDKKSVKHSITE